MQKFPGQNSEWNGDVWKTTMTIRSLMPDWQTFVLDCEYGVGVAIRRKNDQPLSYSKEQIEKNGYTQLELNRELFFRIETFFISE